jgi:hypothetical protein
MKNKPAIDFIVRLLSEETKKIKKKKKKNFSPVAIAPIRRPLGSMFYMDAGVSMAESLNEGYGQKPVTKKFDHLKWQLNEFQKHFLDDFINIPDESLRKEDFEYASKRTGIPLESIKSIKNTLSDKKTEEEIFNERLKVSQELGMGSGGIFDKQIEAAANSEFASVRDLPTDKIGMQWSMNPNPAFRGKSLKELQWSDEMNEKGGQLVRKHERELPGFMYEWLLYYIEGSEKFKITESKLMNDFHSTKFDKYKFVLFSFDVALKESKAHAYDNASTNAKLKELDEINEKLNEFNSMFGTNFIVTNQYTGNDGFLKVVIENAQITDGQRVYEREFINMEDNDIKKAISLGFYDQFTTTRSITG